MKARKTEVSDASAEEASQTLQLRQRPRPREAAAKAGPLWRPLARWLQTFAGSAIPRQRVWPCCYQNVALFPREAAKMSVVDLSRLRCIRPAPKERKSTHLQEIGWAVLDARSAAPLSEHPPRDPLAALP